VDRPSRRWPTSADSRAVTTKMRIRNYSKRAIPTALWKTLARRVGLGDVLPLAVTDEYGIYKERRSLALIVHRSRASEHGDTEATVGSYSLGRIRLLPCPRCSVGFLTFVFLHELCHAWIHQFHERIYEEDETCTFCDRFAERAFETLGGSVPPHASCADFTLNLRRALGKVEEFSDFARARFATRPFAPSDHGRHRKRQSLGLSTPGMDVDR